MHRVIGERDLEETPFGPAEAREVYGDMVRARTFDRRAVALQRRGWMSGYPPFEGQEASQVGAAHAIDGDDWLFPTYRSNALQIARGVPMSDILLFRRGRAEYHSEHDLPVFPQAIPIATQIPHATGVGMAMDHAGEDAAAVCYFGDGATSEGDFHEGLNFAGVFEAPVLFFCENNGWAISYPRAQQTRSDTIAEKAAAYGFEGGRVDGNDPFAVYEIVASALRRVRDGEPVLVESLTYRQGAHTTSDDPSRYRDAAPDLPDWRTRDPIDRVESYLREQGVLAAEDVAEIREDAEADVEAAVDRAESVAPPSPGTVFEHVAATPSPRRAAQAESLEALVERHDVSELDR